MDVFDTNNKRTGKRRTAPFAELAAGLGKLPPQAIDLEEVVLGAIMLEKESLGLVADILKPETFYAEKNNRIYRAILDLFQKSEPVDIRTVTNQLRANGDLEMVGGAYYVAELTAKVQSAANVEYHARILAQYSIKRDLIAISSEIQRDAYEDTVDVFEILDKAEKNLFQVSENNIRRNYAMMSDVMTMALKEIEERRLHKDGLTGVPSGFTALDRLTSGWQRSDLVIIAARPAMGKTAFILSTVRNAAVDHKKACAVFSLEMSSVQLVNRLISAEAELESDKIKKGTLAEYEWVQLSKKISGLTQAPIFIDDTPAISVLELRAKCRRLKAQHDIQLIVIDYLQLMSGDASAKSGGNREQEIAHISRSLKSLAKELNVPVIALSQLSRAVETRGGDKKPQLSDLRESGSIEQDADMVIFLYRPEYYQLTEDAEGNPTAGVGEIIVAKHRNGPVDTVRLRYISKFTKFCDLEGEFEQGGGSVNSFPDVKSQAFGNSGEMRLQSKMNNPQSKDLDLGKFSDYPDEPAPF